MLTLNWMGKEKIDNHRRDVPFRVLGRIPEKGVLDRYDFRYAMVFDSRRQEGDNAFTLAEFSSQILG